MSEIIEITETKRIDLTPIREAILEYERMAGEVAFVVVPEGTTEEIADIIRVENGKRDEQKSYFLHLADMKKEELNKWLSLTQ